jgi:hypothetical protein
MAVRYAVATGNWSSTSTWDGGTLPTSADDVYANNFTVTIDQDVTVLSIRNTAQSPAVAGGGFVLSGTFTVSATGGGFITGATRLLTYTGSNCVLNGNITGSGTTAIVTVYHDSTGLLTINGIITLPSTSPDNTFVIQTNSTGGLNINGDITKLGRAETLRVGSACTVNIVGNLVASTNGSGGSCVNITGAATVNVTGSVSNISGANVPKGIILNNAFCTVNITGDVFHNSPQTSNEVIFFSQPGRVNIVGSVYNLQPNSVTIRSSISSYLSIVGSIYTATAQNVVVSTGSGAINIFSGPFICSPYGFFPLSVVRMHYIKTIGSYFEFRDSSTNGALSPGSIAPAAQLVSPDTVVDAPIPANVRNGVSYALGTFTGTLKVPSPASVAKDVLTDNTVGTAALTPEAVWNHLTANITTANSIGERLKNAATVETTGDQLAALL